MERFGENFCKQVPIIPEVMLIDKIKTKKLVARKMSREEAAKRLPYTRSRSPCSICQEEDHKEQVCPWQICRKCGAKGHIRYTCPFEGTVDNYRLERNMEEVEKELIVIKNSLKTMHEFADQFRDDTDEAIRILKGRIKGQLLPIMGEMFTSINGERERKKQHEARQTGPSKTKTWASKKAGDKEPGTQEEGLVPMKHDTDTARGIVKQEPIRGADPRDVMDKEEWEEMVDFLVFWDALDVDNEGRLEEEVKELHDKYPVDHTLNEHTEERDRKFLQLEKTRKAHKIKNKITKEKTVSHGRKGEKDTTVDERWARELQRRHLARQELGEKLAKMHDDGFEDGLAKGKIDNEWPPENNGREDELLDAFYEDIGLASEQEITDILRNANDFLKEAVSPYVAEAKKRMALQSNTYSGAQLQEDGYNDGFIRGKTVCMDMSGRNKRGDSEDVDLMMDKFYKDISLIKKSGAPERETQKIMNSVRVFLDRTVMTTINQSMAVATVKKPTKDNRKFKFKFTEGNRTPRRETKSVTNDDKNLIQANLLAPDEIRTGSDSQKMDREERLTRKTLRTNEPNFFEFLKDAQRSVSTHRKEMVQAGVNEEHAKVVADGVLRMLNETVSPYVEGAASLFTPRPSETSTKGGEGNKKRGTDVKRGRPRDRGDERRISRRITRDPGTAEAEVNEQEEGKVQTRAQAAATKDVPMEQSTKDE